MVARLRRVWVGSKMGRLVRRSSRKEFQGQIQTIIMGMRGKKNNTKEAEFAMT